MSEGDKAGAETECVIGRVLRFGDQCRDVMQLPGLDKQAITGARRNREDRVFDVGRRKETVKGITGRRRIRKKEEEEEDRTKYSLATTRVIMEVLVTLDSHYAQAEAMQLQLVPPTSSFNRLA